MLTSGLTAFRAEKGLDNVHTWGQTLGSAGYDSYIWGKWHLDATVLQRSFKEVGPVAPGFLPSNNEIYDRPSPGNNWKPWDQSLSGHWLQTNLWENETPSTIEHSSRLYANNAIDYLTNQAAKRDAPFFIYISASMRHTIRGSLPRSSWTSIRKTRSRFRQTFCLNILSTKEIAESKMNCSLHFLAQKKQFNFTVASITPSSRIWTNGLAAFWMRWRSRDARRIPTLS
jgi:arylsulfatase A-like enzyme